MKRNREFFPQTSREKLLAEGGWEKPRRVLALQASHRGGRGFTAKVCDAITGGMKRAGAEVKTIILADLEFAPCRGCFKCWAPVSERCPLEDDLTPLIDSVPSYDLMLWALPLYVDAMPGLLKNAVDRMMVLNHPAILERDGRCIHPSRHQNMPALAVAATCGFWGRKNFGPLVAHLEALSLDQHTPLLAFMPRPDSLSLMDPDGRNEMAGVADSLAEAGQSLIERGSIPPKLLDEVCKPLLARSRYLELGKNWWKGRR